VKRFSEALTNDRMLAQRDQLKRKNCKPGFDRMTAGTAKIWIQVYCRHEPFLNLEKVKKEQKSKAEGLCHPK